MKSSFNLSIPSLILFQANNFVRVLTLSYLVSLPPPRSPCPYPRLALLLFLVQLDGILSAKGVAIDKVINLVVDDTTLIRRVLGR